MDWFLNQSPVMQVFIATIFTYTVTILGASSVFFFKKLNRSFLDSMLGFGAGVMIAAVFWSLLEPAVEMSHQLENISWLPVLSGFLCGGLFLLIIDVVLPHLHMNKEVSEAEGIKTSWHRSVLLVLAITLHNIPEGLALGVAFGAASLGYESASILTAVALAVGIGLQNYPEGMAVSVPLRREGMSRSRAFYFGQLSGMIQPLAGVIGTLLVVSMKNILPFSLSFAAGSMIYVVVEELIPESQSNKETKLATIAAIMGFAIMMTIDIALA